MIMILGSVRQQQSVTLWHFFSLKISEQRGVKTTCLRLKHKTAFDGSQFLFSVSCYSELSDQQASNNFRAFCYTCFCVITFGDLQKSVKLMLKVETNAQS